MNDDGETCEHTKYEEQGNNWIMNEKQPAPIPNQYPAIWPLVIEDVKLLRIAPVNSALDKVYASLLEDMEERDNFGRSKYQMPLQMFNGRDCFKDAYQELLDYIAYMKQAYMEAKDGTQFKGFLGEMVYKAINTAVVSKMWVMNFAKEE